MIEVSGQVSDATTGGGIPAATIAVNGKAVGAADSSGNFTVQLNSYNDTITASSVGYQPLTLPAYQVQESGDMQLGIDAESLAAATVTASTNKSNWGWWALAGVAIVASGKSHAAMSGKSSNLVPIALLGIGGLLLLKSNTSLFAAPTSPAGPVSSLPNPTGGNSSIFPSTGLPNLADIFKGLFGSSGPSYAPIGVQPIPGTSSPGSPAANYPTIPITPPSIPIAPGAYDNGDYDDDVNAVWEMGLSGMGATTTINAGDIIGKTMIAAMRVPLYDAPRDDAQPSGYVTQGNPIGIVFSYLNPDTSQGRAELWWMFEPLPGNSDIGNDQGYYFVPHNPDYFDTKALTDAGVLTVAQATALKNADSASDTWLDTAIKKYGPYVIGGLVVVGLGKAVINKVV